MKLSIISLLALATYGQTAQSSNSGGLTIETSSGSFTGFIDPEFPSTRQFRSIPFAEPPVASRRWLPPQKLSAPLPGQHYSTKFPPSCPQFVTAVESIWNSPLTKGNLIYNGAQNDSSGLVGEATSEDCLYLAIWAPAQIPKEGLPVSFFMTGGGFIIGGVELPWQNPISWVERSKSHIVVSINYRVNIFGFPNARGLPIDEQNLGILDQRAALEWVRDNIAAFGGDPTRIMQWGRSAGSASVDAHTYAYHDDPIAQSFFMESATILGQSPYRDLTFSNFSFVAKHVGCGSPCGVGIECEDEDGSAELDCMRQVSMLEISNFVGQYNDRAEQPPLAFSVITDDHIIFSDYPARAAAGKISNGPTIISATSNEMSSLVPWPSSNLTQGPYQPDVDALNVLHFVCPIFNSTVYRNRLDIPVFRFQYAAEFPNLNVYDWLGAYHNAETPLIFGTYGQLDHIANSTERQVEMSNSMQDYLLAFIEDPYNGPQTLGWKPMDTTEPDGGFLLRFGGKSGKVSLGVDGNDVDGVCLGLRDYDAFP